MTEEKLTCTNSWALIDAPLFVGQGGPWVRRDARGLAAFVVLPAMFDVFMVAGPSSRSKSRCSDPPCCMPCRTDYVSCAAAPEAVGHVCPHVRAPAHAHAALQHRVLLVYTLKQAALLSRSGERGTSRLPGACWSGLYYSDLRMSLEVCRPECAESSCCPGAVRALLVWYLER
jgi:hypothetical protein